MSKILLLLPLFFLNCSYAKKDGKGPANKKLVEVNYRMFICQGEASQWCLQVKDKGDTTWQYYYDTIEKFKYEWGYNYVLDVERKTIKNAAQDASSIRWILKSIVKKIRIPANTIFSIGLDEEKALYDSKKKKIIILGKAFAVAKSFPVNKLAEFTTLDFHFSSSNIPEVFRGK